MSTATLRRGARSHLRGIVIATAVVAVLVALLAATGQLGRGRPYWGPEHAVDEDIKLARFTYSLHGAALVTEQHQERLRLYLSLKNQDSVSLKGPVPGAVVVLVAGEAALLERCESFPTQDQFQPGLRTRAICSVALADVPLSLPRGDVEAVVVFVDEERSDDYLDLSGWTLARAGGHVKVTVEENRDAA